jgi:hypothetical protein
MHGRAGKRAQTSGDEKFQHALELDRGAAGLPKT